MSSKREGIHSRKKPIGAEVEKRIVVIDPDKCKPNSTAFQYFKRYAKSCPTGKLCFKVSKKTVVVEEWACPPCVNRCKQAPGDAVSVVKLPSNLTTDTTHRYGPNTFKLHGLPTPRPGHVLGLLGTNGTGKSTALSILSGRLKPNLGVLEAEKSPEWADIVRYYRGSDLQNFLSAIIEDRLGVVTKPQLSAGFGKRFKGKTCRQVLKVKDDRGMMDRYAKELDLEHLLDREIPDLSGGELQRFTVACVLCRKADVYMFDEVTSFLDVKQRLQVTDLIRSLVHEGDMEWKDEGGVLAAAKKYIIVVEHDLAILDYMSDYVQCLYGASGAYGVITGRLGVRNGINQFLAGYINASNMRFRDHELTFKVNPSEFKVIDDDIGEEKKTGKPEDGPKRTGFLRYPKMQQVRQRKDEEGNITTKFVLNVEAGNFRDGECIALLGENGTGKTTFMEMLAGKTRSQRGKEGTIGSYAAEKPEDGAGNPSLAALGVAYKTQGLDPRLRRFKGSVSAILEQTINKSLGDRLFRLLVLRALSIGELMDLPVASLSGGEMQRLSIAICLGTPALVYLIDEPSAGLDCEQRVICAKAMKRWVVSHLGRTIFLVEHDFVMASAMADRVIVYSGRPGIECTAGPPMSVTDGFNAFLKQLNVTFRKDPINYRPRINKKNSRLDKAQKAAGEYYLFEVDEDDDFDDI